MNTSQTVRTLSALAQETRLAAFRLLVRAGPEGMPVGRMAEALGVAMPTLSFHLKELAQAGLVQSQAQSRFVIYRADYGRMRELLSYLTENCCAGVEDGRDVAPSCSSSCESPIKENAA